MSAHVTLGRVETSAVERLGRAVGPFRNLGSGLGLVLRAGQVVTTGTCLVPLPIGAGDRILADFGEIGQVTLRIGL